MADSFECKKNESATWASCREGCGGEGVVTGMLGAEGVASKNRFSQPVDEKLAHPIFWKTLCDGKTDD